MVIEKPLEESDSEQLPMYLLSARNRHHTSRSSPSPPQTPLQGFLPSTRNDNYRARSFFRPRTLLKIIKIVIPAIILILLSGFYLYEPHIELAFYNRNWIHEEVDRVFPLSGCFDASRVSPKYNVSDGLYGRRRTEVQAGMQLKMGLDCYDFAGTVQSQGETWRLDEHVSEEDRTHYHTYWRTDLAPFGPRQEWMLKSFFATQNVRTSRLILWSNGDLSSNTILAGYVRRYPQAFALRVVNIPLLATGTALDGSDFLQSNDSKAWVDGDLARLLLLWNYGGVWVDMDSLMTRDMEPLLEHEFVTQWDCYDKIYKPFNGALMHFHQHSPYLCEAFHIMATSKAPRSGSTDWGSLLYLKLWRRLVAGSIPPFKILPFCFSDARSCRLDNRLPDPFVQDNAKGKWTMGLGLEEGGGLDQALGKVFSVHLHNQWEKAFPSGGWVDRLLLRKYDKKLQVREQEGYLLE